MTAASSLVRHPGRNAKLKGSRPFLPNPASSSIVNGHTVYQSSIKNPDEGGRILKDGHNNPKIGRRVDTGVWKGMPILTLTLEERATCPRECALWRRCYGNNMHLAERWQHGRALEEYLELELRWLAKMHSGGFVVRLHILGDFYSEEYVRLWRRMMDELPMLRVFGFTAQIDADDPITIAIAEILRAHPDRWFVRFSNAPLSRMAAEVIDMPDQASPGAIVCPQQTGKTAACATCALCWQTDKTIAFLSH